MDANNADRVRGVGGRARGRGRVRVGGGVQRGARGGVERGASQVKSSHLYLYSAFNNTNCNKALHNIKIGKMCQ